MVERFSIDRSQRVIKPTDDPQRDSSLALALALAEAASDRKGEDIAVLHVADVSYLADYFVIVTAFSRAQARAIANAMQEKAELDRARRPQHIEGQTEGSWILLDFGDAIAHILQEREREFYNLDAFWGHAERLPFVPEDAAEERDE